MNNFLDKIPVSPITSFGNPSVPNGATFGTNFSILQTGGYMEVYNLSGLTYTIPPATTGNIEFSGNSIPIQFTKGSGLVFSSDVLTLNSDNISSGRRKLGMLVYVYETNKIYQFRIDNYETLWNNATGATGIGGQTVVISDYGTTVKNNSAAGIAFINAWTASTISGIGGNNDTNASWRILKTGGDSFTGGTVTGATNFTNGLTANTISATTYTNVNHNNTTNLQGGQPSEYYHLTSSQLNRVLNLIYVNNVVTFSISPTSGERGVSQPLSVTYRMIPNDDTYTAATINPVGYNVLPFANGVQQTTGVTNSSTTTSYTLNYGYVRNTSGNTSFASASYAAYIPQWNGVSVSSGLTSNTYSAVTSLGLTKVVQSSPTQIGTFSATNQYVWFISNISNATITQGGFTQSISALNVYDGTKEFQKNSVFLTLSDGITTSVVYTYRTTSVKNITSLNYQIT